MSDVMPSHTTAANRDIGVVSNGSGATIVYQVSASERWQAMVLPPKNVGTLVGRANDLAAIKELLQTGHQTVVLRGEAGVGKSALVASLAFDDDFRKKAFPDGVLWASIGSPRPSSASASGKRETDINTIVHTWARALRIDLTGFNLLTDEQRITLVRSAIGHKRILLIIDDVWERSVAAQLLSLTTPTCGVLIAGREFDLFDLPYSHDYKLKPLAAEDGSELLRQEAAAAIKLIDGPVAESELAWLDRRLNNLPLSITLVGGVLRRAAHANRREDVQKSLRELRDELDPPTKRLGTGSAAHNLYVAVKASAERLSDQSSRLLRSMTILPPKPNTFSKAIARAFGGADAEAALAELVDAGLVELQPGRESQDPARRRDPLPGNLARPQRDERLLVNERYCLHQTVWDYAHDMLKTEGETKAARDTLIKMVTDLGTMNWIDPDHVQDTMNMLEAVHVAYEQRAWRTMVTLVQVVFPYLEAGGLYHRPDVLRLIKLARERARVLDNREHAQATLNLAIVAEKQGDYGLSESLLRSAISMTRHLPDADQLRGEILLLMGVVSFNCCEYELAAEQLSNAIPAITARDTHSLRRLCLARRRLAAVYIARGELERSAEQIVMGWEAAFSMSPPDNEQMSGLHLVQGVLAFNRGEGLLARQALVAAHVEARRINHREREVAVLQMLAAVEHNRDDVSYPRAMAYLRRARKLVEQVRHQWYAATVECEMGELSLKRRDIAGAETAFQKAIEICPQQCADRRGFALFGLARTHLATGRLEDARSRCTESLDLFEQIGHVAAAETRSVLVAILMDLAEEAYRERQLGDADDLFGQARQMSSVERLDQQAFALYGSGRVAFARGDIGRGLGLVDEAAALFVKCGHPKLERVQQWLREQRRGQQLKLARGEMAQPISNRVFNATLASESLISLGIGVQDADSNSVGS